MNRREFLSLAAVAPMVAPAVVESLAAAELPAGTPIIAGMDLGLEPTVTVIEEWTCHRSGWILRWMALTPAEVGQIYPARPELPWVVFDEVS